MSTKQKLLSISGGGTKFIGLFEAVRALITVKGFRPDVLVGVSSGAIISFVVAVFLGAYVPLNLWMEIRDIGLNLDKNTFFSSSPVTSRGKVSLSAVWRLLTGKPGLGAMGNLEKLLRKIITKEMFESFKSNPNSPQVYVSAISYLDASRSCFHINELDYDTAIKAVLASSSIPVFTEPVIIDGVPYFDGGVRDHSAGAHILELYKSRIGEMVSVYSRPENLEQAVFKSSYQPDPMPILQRTIDIMNMEISKDDEFRERTLGKRYKCRQTFMFLPSIMDSVYDTDNARLARLADAGYKIGIRYRATQEEA